jgi:hypothetical protein
VTGGFEKLEQERKLRDEEHRRAIAELFLNSEIVDAYDYFDEDSASSDQPISPAEKLPSEFGKDGEDFQGSISLLVSSFLNQLVDTKYNGQSKSGEIA